MPADRALRRTLFATALMVTVAACGTTVPLSSQVAQGQGPSSDLTAGGPTDGGLGPSSAPGSVAGPRGATNNNAPGAGPTAGQGTTTTPGSVQPLPGQAGTIGASAPGVTRSTITIGMLTASGAGAYQRSLGFDKGATGDQIAMVRSVVDWLNKRGGIGGRKVRVVVHDIKPTDAASDQSTTYQAACTTFTQDNKVFAVASILSTVPPNFYECLRKQGVTVVTAIPQVSSRFFQQYAGFVYSPPSPSYTRILAQSVDALWDDGWLKASSKVGVVGFDSPDARAAVTDGLIPALKRRGLSLVDGLYTATDTSSAAEYNGGVLKFKTNQVDRVFFAPGGQPILFALAAEQAAYHPLYEIGTLEYPGPVAATLPAAQMRGAAGLGWSPDLDLSNASAAKVPTPAKAMCKDAVRSANQDLTTGTTLAIATWICDDWFFLRDVLAGATVINPSTFRAAVERLGSTFRSATTFGTAFGPGRSDGAASYRLNKYNESCSCFAYASPLRTLR
jgi:ABC-type branched-subunit amino acid transport system substrate-binding protein